MSGSVDAIGSFAGGISASDAGRMRDKMFAKIDANSDGSLDKSELQTFADTLSSKFGGSSDGMADRLLGAADTNADGVVSKGEFASARPPFGGSQASGLGQGGPGERPRIVHDVGPPTPPLGN